MKAFPMPLPGQLPAEAARNSAPWWPVFRDLRLARAAFGLKARHLTTLAALLSFLKPDDPQMMVFASNAAILERLNGLSERSFQRHILDLLAAGLLRRVDSPNGKRFRLRGAAGDSLSFGFDLTPLMARADLIRQEADAEAARLQALMLLRQQVLCALARQEAAGAPAEVLHSARVALRRNLTAETLHQMLAGFDMPPAPAPEAATGCDRTEPVQPDLAGQDQRITPAEMSGTAEMSASYRQNVGHIQKSDTEDSYEKPEASEGIAPHLLLTALKQACPNLGTWFPEGASGWREILGQIRQVAGWVGIQPDLYRQAEDARGAECTAATLLAILERGAHIRQPAAYFRSLMLGKRKDNFTGRKLLAWLNQEPGRAVIRG